MPYDPKLTLWAAIKFGAISALSVFLSNEAGLTAWIMQYVPAQYAAVAPIVLGMIIASLKNWVTNRKKA